MSTRQATAQDVGAAPERGTRVSVEGTRAVDWSAVVDVRDGDLIALTVEPGVGVPADVREGRSLLLTYTHRQVPCEADAVVVGTPSTGGDDRVHVRLSAPARRNQRRCAVRVPVDLVLRARAAETPDDGEEPLQFAAVTENLSAGGALMRSGEAVHAGTELAITLHTGGDDPVMDLRARVVRCDKVPGAVRPWRVALVFLRITPTQEDHLVRYLFRVQREARRRESGMAS